jgi:hypothetical protein
MNIRLKKRIFDRLYEVLKDVEIIDCEDSIWFVDRDKEYWYLEYKKSGKLYWMIDFFTDFFLLFSMGLDEYEQVIAAEWVEEVLNCKVDSTFYRNEWHFIKFMTKCQTATNK